MEVLNKTEHQKCFCYEKGVKPTVEIRTLKQGFEEELTLKMNEIVFMMEGEVRYRFRDHPEKLHGKDEFVFIPVCGVFRFVVLKDTTVVVFRLNGSLKLCDGRRIEELYVQSSIRSGSVKREIYPLEINRPIQLFLAGLYEVVSGGLACRYYFDTKAKELFILLRTYYPRQELSEFFSLILTPDTLFSEYIRANHHKYKTVKELAETMHMTPKLFSKKFSQIFGEPAFDWMSKEKALCIYSELYSGNEPLGLIADKYGFSSQSHLNKFCKREFGENPGEIRSRLKVQKKATNV